MHPTEYDSLSPSEAIAYQKELRNRIQLKTFDRPVRTIAGADVSFNKFSPVIYAGIVVLSYPQLEEIEQVSVTTTTNFKYIPGLLAFREMPALMLAWKKLTTKPDILVFDGQGYAHPRRMGIATHFGIVTNTATIGCGKTRLTGSFQDPANEAGAKSELLDKDEKIGIVLRTKRNCKPVFVSPGHLISIDQSADIIFKCVEKYRVPEPTRQAHLWVNKERRKHLADK